VGETLPSSRGTTCWFSNGSNDLPGSSTFPTMKARHAAALALVGWYLMVSPAGKPGYTSDQMAHCWELRYGGRLPCSSKRGKRRILEF
jgi:hypothetical protein